MTNQQKPLAKLVGALERGIGVFFDRLGNVLDPVFDWYFRIWEKMKAPAAAAAKWCANNISFAWVLAFIAGFPICFIFLIFWSILNFVTAGILGLFVAVSIPYFLGLSWYWYIIISLPLYVVLAALIMFIHVVDQIEYAYDDNIRSATLGPLFEGSLEFFWFYSAVFHLVFYMLLAVANPPWMGLPSYQESHSEPIQIEITIREVQESRSE